MPDIVLHDNEADQRLTKAIRMYMAPAPLVACFQVQLHPKANWDVERGSWLLSFIFIPYNRTRKKQFQSVTVSACESHQPLQIFPFE